MPPGQQGAMTVEGAKETAGASPFVDKIVAPGDAVVDLNTVGKVLRLGSGLRQDGDAVVALRAGRLRSTKHKKLWLESSQKRYLPAADDVVIGTITDRHAENFDVDIGGPALALLPVLAFEGATRRNLPRLKVGAAIYARVVTQHPDKAPELACMDVAGKSSGFGPLAGGYIFECSTGLARALLGRPTFPALVALGESLAFELAVGMNGRIWVNAPSPDKVVLVTNAILNAEFLSPAQQQSMVKKLLQRLK